MLRPPLAVLAAAMVAASTARAAPEAQRFDLACHGRIVTTGQRGRFDKPISTLASVDLATKRFCWRGKACAPFPIRRSEPDRLTLRDEHTAQGSLVYVVRWPSGDYASDGRIHLLPPPNVISHEQGTCRRLPFTPF